jgi:putative sterol carrier protein
MFIDYVSRSQRREGMTMSNLDQLTAQLRAAVAHGGISRTVKFDLKGDGVIHLDSRTVTNEDKAADCTIVLSKSDLESLVDGKVDGTSLFMAGKMRIDGDMSVAMMLQPVLSGARS